MKKFLAFLLSNIVTIVLAQTGNVGINTPNPQQLLHIDGGIDNNKTGAPTATQVLNDVVVTKDGNVGVADINPKISFVARPNGTTTEREGLLIPKITRARAIAMAPNTPNATIVFVDTLDGSMTGPAIDMNNPGFYYFDKPNNTWRRLQYNADTIGKSVSTMLYTNTTFDAIDTQSVKCGKYLFRYADVTGGSSFITPQIALSEPPASSITVNYGVETRFVTNGIEFQRNQKTFTTANVYQDMDNTFAPGEVNILYIAYPGENLFYKVTFFAQKNTTTISSFNITCEIY